MIAFLKTFESEPKRLVKLYQKEGDIYGNPSPYQSKTSKKTRYQHGLLSLGARRLAPIPKCSVNYEKVANQSPQSKAPTRNLNHLRRK